LFGSANGLSQKLSRQVRVGTFGKRNEKARRRRRNAQLFELKREGGMLEF
jgi:hypothetical protein